MFYAAVPAISTGERRGRLLRRLHLDRSATSVEEIAAALVGLHSSDPVTVFLSCWARIDGFQPALLEEALYERRSLLRLLGMRRTMFVVGPDLAATMNSACTRVLAPRERKKLIGFIEDQALAKDGARWLARTEKATLAALRARGEATAKELTEDVPQLTKKLQFGEGKKWAGSVGMSTRVLFLLATDGKIIRGRPLGTWRSSQYRWASMDAWSNGLNEVDPAKARADLIGRWLASYGPGTLTDLKWWTGLTVTQTKAAIEEVGAVEVELDNGTGFVLPDDVATTPTPDSDVALLPGLDPALMGWKERDWLLPAGDHGLFDTNGNAGPTVWADGRVVGGWAQRNDGKIAIRLLEDVARETRQAIEARARGLEDWLGEHRAMTRFPSPLEKELKS